jgi:hypothetical protein
LAYPEGPGDDFFFPRIITISLGPVLEVKGHWGQSYKYDVKELEANDVLMSIRLGFLRYRVASPVLRCSEPLTGGLMMEPSQQEVKFSMSRGIVAGATRKA